MRLRRHRPAPPPAPNPAIGVDVNKVIREEFERADAVAGPVLHLLAARHAIVTHVDLDNEHGSAVLTFDDGTKFRVATGHPDLPQLRAAARLVAARLYLTTVLPNGVGRLLVFEAASWTIYLTVDLAVLL